MNFSSGTYTFAVQDEKKKEKEKKIPGNKEPLPCCREKK